MKYHALSVTCDLSTVSLQEAALQVGPAFEYDLMVSPELRWIAYDVAQAVGEKDNPFSPYINIRIYRPFGLSEWCLCANDKAAGSKGCDGI